MSVVVVSVAVLAVLVLVDLALTGAVIRRLRLLEKGVEPDIGGPEIGAEAPRFSTTTEDGRAFDRTDLNAPTVIGFFSTDCGVCTTEVTRFAEFTASRTDDDLRVVAVVQAGFKPSEPMIDALRPVPVVVVEKAGDPGVYAAFDVLATPSYYVLDGTGSVLAKGLTLDSVGKSHPAVA